MGEEGFDEPDGVGGDFFFFIGAVEVSSMLLILFYFAYDVFQMATPIGGGVAYLAHLSGYLYGFCVGMALLWSRLLAREPYDLLSLLAHRRRRAKFAAKEIGFDTAAELLRVARTAVYREYTGDQVGVPAESTATGLLVTHVHRDAVTAGMDILPGDAIRCARF